MKKIDEKQADKQRSVMHRLEEKLNELTKGEFFGFCASRGLETFTISEIKALYWKHYSPEFDEVLRKCIREHKEFYENYHGCLLDDESLKSDSSAQNILVMWKWKGKGFSLKDWIKQSSFLG